MASIPRPRPIAQAVVAFLAVFAVGTAHAGAMPAGDKPEAGVAARWVTAGTPVPGSFAEVTLQVSTRFPVERLRIEVPVPPGLETAGPPPAYDGPLEPGAPLALPFRVRVPRGTAPPLQARITVESAGGRYRTGAFLELGPVRDSSPAAHGARVVHTPRGDVLQFPAAVRTPPTPIRPRSARAPGALPVTITGRFFYRDRAFDPNGFVNADSQDDPLRPIRHANVDLLVSGVYKDTGSTDDTGAFSFTYNGTAEDTYQVRVMSSSDQWGGSDIRVKRSSIQPTLYSVAPQASKPGGSTDLGDFVAEPGSGGEAFNVLDCCLVGAELVHSLTGSYPSHPVSVYWNADPGYQGTYYSAWNIQLFGGADPDNPDEEGYDDSVIIHEYGHYVADLYSKLNPAGGLHYIDDSNQPPILSWNEGWASYFQAAARARAGDPYPSWYVDMTDQPGAGALNFSYDCEGPSLPLKGTGSEVVVQAALWDIEDGPATPDPWPGVDDDPLTLSRSLTWSVVSSWPSAGPSVTLESFWDSWFAAPFVYGHLPEMESVFGALGAEFYPDALEGDGTPARATPLALDGTPVHHTFYPAGDVDYHRMSLVSGDQVSIETLNILSYGDTRLEIYDPTQSLLASNDNRTDTDFTSFVSFTAPSTGVYLVKVSRADGGYASQVRYGSYDIRALPAVLNPVSLASAAAAAGVDNTGYGVGVAFADADADGFPDLYVVNNTAAGTTPAKDAFYRNAHNGTFTDLTASAGFGNPEGGVGAAWGDYDNDGRPDLFVTDHGLFHNEGDAHFTDVTTASGVTDIGREFDAAWVDADNDGLLDLFVLRRDGPSALWHNEGDGTFTDLAPQAGFDFPADGADAYGCAWADYDRDRLPDLFMARLQAPYHSLYHNLGGNRFEEVTEAAGVAGADPAHGALWGDLNNDGWVDLFVASSGADALYLNRGDGTFENRSSAWGVNDPGTAVGAALADVDLDGDLDLYVVNLTTSNILFQNLGSAMLRMSGAAVPSPDSGPDYGCAWADVDADGDPDLYVSRGSPSPNLLYRSTLNNGASPRPWLGVELEGTLSNRDGLGARVEVYSGNLVQTREVGTGTGWASKSRLPELFGFPDGASVDSVKVLWPSTARSVIRSPAPNTVLHVTEDPRTPVLPPPVTPTFSVHLGAPSPNPFVGATGVSFKLSSAADVRVEIFDLAGRKVRTLIDRRLEAGRHIAGWDGSDDWGRTAPPGVYFYRLEAGGRTEVRKLVRLSR
jgi:hypothetical protein